nr:MAG TPA: hypothetical protein [Caudoviricetes sp.]
MFLLHPQPASLTPRPAGFFLSSRHAATAPHFPGIYRPRSPRQPGAGRRALGGRKADKAHYFGGRPPLMPTKMGQTAAPCAATAQGTGQRRAGVFYKPIYIGVHLPQLLTI